MLVVQGRRANMRAYPIDLPPRIIPASGPPDMPPAKGSPVVK